MTVVHGSYYGSCNITNSMFHRAGLGAEVLQYMRAAKLTWSEVEASAEAFDPVCAGMMGYITEEQCYSQKEVLVAQMRRRQWLLAPDEIGKETMEQWLRGVPAAWGTSANGLLDALPSSDGMFTGGDCAEVFESLERYEEGLAAAQADLKHYDQYPPMSIMSGAAIGRCQAKLGRPEEAAAAFKAAIITARRTEFPFLELLARRDYIVHVLDAQGARDAQMAQLGDCISRMVLAPAAYTTVLGEGLDAEAAVAAFNAQREITGT